MTDEGKTWDVAVVGAGPAGMFVARTLAGKLSVLVLDEKGRTGGAGAMTDGKPNLSPHIGLARPRLLGAAEDPEGGVGHNPSAGASTAHGDGSRPPGRGPDDGIDRLGGRRVLPENARRRGLPSTRRPPRSAGVARRSARPIPGGP